MRYDRVYNFSAGPAMMPESVLEEIAAEVLNYHGSGMSVMEMSHRSPVFQEILSQAEADLRTLMHIPDNYKVLFIQGGGTVQFAMVPMNLMKNGVACYVETRRRLKKYTFGRINPRKTLTIIFIMRLVITIECPTFVPVSAEDS